MSDDHTNPHEIRLYAALEDASEAVEAERRRLAGLLETGVIGPLNTLLAQARERKGALKGA